MTHYIIEGVDNLGKDKLISNIQKTDGPYIETHFQAPVLSKKIEKAVGYSKKSALLEYQSIVYANAFKLLNSNNSNNSINFIFNRFHLGECVYGPLYRDYSGEYVFKLENELIVDNIRMILLVTSDFSFIREDGNSIDVTKKAKEQELFINAFYCSNIKNKIIIDVNNKGEYLDENIITSMAINTNIKSLNRARIRTGIYNTTREFRQQ